MKPINHPAYDRLSRQLVAAMAEHLKAKKRPQIPVAGVELWAAFITLSRTRSYSSFGPNPISYQEIEAWCRLHRMPLEPHHIQIICALDQEWLKGGEGKTAPVADLTPAAFDAVLG